MTAARKEERPGPDEAAGREASTSDANPPGKTACYEAAADTRSSTKRLATCKARCALVGVVLHELTGDDGQPEYVVTQTRWALTRAFRSLDELEAWLPRLEGARP